MKSYVMSLSLFTLMAAPLAASADWRGWRGDNDCNHNPGRGIRHELPVYSGFHPGKPKRVSFTPQSSWREDRDLVYGVRSGRLSEREVDELREKSWRLREEEARYFADGYLTHHEREDLRNDRDDYLGSLDHELNDGERRW